MRCRMSSRRSKYRRGFLLVELLVTFGIMAFVFPLAFFCIARLIAQTRASCAELELREAASHWKTFLDASRSSFAGQRIALGRDAEEDLAIAPLLSGGESPLPFTDFLAESCALADVRFPSGDEDQLLCSPRGGVWKVFRNPATGGT